MGTQNILSEEIQTISYGVTRMSAVRVVLQLPGALWKKVTVGHGWKHVKWGDCLLCQLLPQFLQDWWLSRRSQKSLSPEQDICKKKTLSDGLKFPTKCEEGQCTPSGAHAARLWWKWCSKDVTCPQPRAVEIAAAGRKEARESQGPCLLLDIRRKVTLGHSASVFFLLYITFGSLNVYVKQGHPQRLWRWKAVLDG